VGNVLNAQTLLRYTQNVLFDEGDGKNLIKKTLSSARGLKTCFFALLIGAMMILSTFTLICAAAPTTVELNLLAEESGALRSDGAMTTVVNAGDTETDEGVQAFLSFDISSIPPGSTISDVVVDFSDYTVYGDPFDGSLGDGYLRGYLHDYGTLDGEDYYPDSPTGTIMLYHTPEELDVPASDMNVAEVLQNKLGSSRFQLRLQFQPPATNNNGVADVIQFQDVKLTVTFEAPVDFSVSASPVSRAVNPGVSTSYIVTLTSFGGFSDSVSLSVDGLPSGVTGVFDSSTVTPTGTVILTVSTGVSAPVGTSTLTITGSGGGLTRQATVIFEVSTTPTELDETPPVASAGQDLTVNVGATVTFSAAGSTDNVGIVSYEWDFGDGTSGTGVTISHTYEDVGTYNVTLTVTDAAGNFSTVTIVITAEGAKAAEFPYWILIPIIIGLIAAVVIVWFLLKRRKKEKLPKPAKIKMTVDSTEILADGKSTVKITIELLDEKEKPVSALADTEIKLVSSSGKLKKPVLKIPKGKGSEQTSLLASKEAGAATVSATAKGLDRAVITVAFREKKRYCMHCGTKMPFTSKRCPECGKSPPAGVDTKACKNCNAVIPAVAKFCAECGASQPKQEE
jgi:PKD repeat protein/RNA polymerase subunit RPABC4/transcription elongation factor Spt4